MSSVMECEKENQEPQIVNRKTGVVESIAPRTPFANVNRQQMSQFASSPAGSNLKSSQVLKRRSHSWAPDSLLQRPGPGTNETLFTPLRSDAKKTPLRKQVLKKEEDLGDHEEISNQAAPTGESQSQSYSLPSSPIVKLPESDSVEDLLPVVSHSCPDMLPSGVPLPAITEASPHNPNVCLQVSPSALPALSPIQGPTESTGIDLSMECEEGSLLQLHPSCESESEVDASFHGGEDLENGSSYVNCTSESSASGTSRCSLLSDEGLRSETDWPLKDTVTIPDDTHGKIILSEPPRTQATEENKAVCESVQAVHYILEEILCAVEEQVNEIPQLDQNEDNNALSSQNSTNPANVPTRHEPTYMSEYVRFMESYGQEGSPAFPNAISSLTSITPFSQDSEAEGNSPSAISGTFAGSRLVVVDSLTSFISDSGDSFSSANTIQRRLTFEDTEMKSPKTNLDDSMGFVRSSESWFDLREDRIPLELRMEREDSAERNFLNLSLTDQGVEFIALPPKLRSVASSPIDIQHQIQSCSPMLDNIDAESSKSSCDVLSSTVTVQDVQTMTVNAETTSTAASPIVVPKCEKSTVTDIPKSPAVTDICSIGLSPIPMSVCEKEANTSITQTSDADTMTYVPTSEVALSPMIVAKKEIDTMTTVTATTESGMITEMAEYLDHSMLATAETDCKTTMTDSTGRRSISTTMTPFKTLVKQGRRLTADDIRKQHPRALANQLEMLTVANSRLESEVRLAHQDNKRLQGALKEAKHLASSRQTKLDAAEKLKEKELKEVERQQQDRCQQLEQLCQEQQSRMVSLEQELSTLRAESEAAAQKQLEDIRVMQEKCQVLEETHACSSERYEQEIQELKRSEESNSYRQQFERAQQMVREREAELNEIKGLFTDLQTTACKQENLHSAYQEIHNKIMTLARENRALRDNVAKRASLSREEVEHQQAELGSLQQHNISLVQEVESLRNTMAINNNNLAELEKLYSLSSSDLLTATGRVLELNTEMFEARKALQEAVQSKETLARQAHLLEEQLSALQETQATLTAALTHTQAQLRQHKSAYGNLQAVSQKMKKVYEDKLENMALGAENMQQTMHHREVDMNNMEKDLYECRNIIVEQRYKIDGLESDLQESRSVVAQKKAEEEDIEFFKKSNAFLEAERSVYVQSIRDLEEKLKTASLQSAEQKQTAVDAEQLVEELQEDKLRLITELSDIQRDFLNASRALSQAKEEHDRVERVVTASANDLLQHMQLMLVELKKKTGLQEVPEVCLSEIQSQRLPSQSKSVKSKRHSRKSFVSKILGAATKTEVEQGADQDSDWEKVESGSYVGGVIPSPREHQGADAGNLSSMSQPSILNRGVKEVTVSSGDTTFRDQGSEVIAQSQTHNTVSSRRRKLNFSDQPLSVSWTESSAPSQGLSGSSAFRPLNLSSSSLPPHPPYSLHHPSSSEPPSSGVAKIRSIPKTKRRSEQPSSSHRSPVLVMEGVGEAESGMVSCLMSLKEKFMDISRLARILDRATQLSLQDLREENDMLRERTEILEDSVERSNAALNICQQESVAKDNTILELQQQSRNQADQMIACTDQKFQIKRLNDELKRLERELQQEQREKDLLSAELNSVLQSVETSNTSADRGAAQAQYLRDNIALKKKIQRLFAQLEEEREHYEELGSKAARRMRVLDDNWKKAEDELYRLDDLVESIRQIAEQNCQSSSPRSDLHRIQQLILGDRKSSPL